MATLQMLKGETPGRLFELSRDTTIIGRHPGCDIVLSIGAVSRQHARIVHRPAGFYLEDLKSRNGTQVDGKDVSEPVQLQDGDQIKICDHLLIFHASPVELPPGPAGGGAAAASPGLVVVQDENHSNSTVLSVLDVSGSSELRFLDVKPEVKLRAILEISRNLSSTLRLEDVLDKTLGTLFKIFPQADRSFVLLKDNQANRLIPKAIKYRRGDSDSLTISRTIVNQVLNEGKAILSADAVTDSRFNMSQSISDFKIRSMMCVPILNQGRVPVGIIQIDTRDRRSNFSQEDLDLLVAVAGQASMAIENAWLHETLLHQKEIEQELQFARQVQQGFLPQQKPQVTGYEFWHFYEPALSVGGDYFDYIAAAPPGAPCRQVAVALGDVSGKGMPAALLMARLSSEVRLCIHTETEPARVVERLNHQLSDASIQDKFVTFLLVVIDAESHRLTVVNAGHMGPMIRRAAGPIDVIGEGSSGLPLAVVRDQEYRAASTVLEPGDVVVLYTDGVSEAMNPDNSCFGIERVEQVLRSAPAGVAPVGEAIIQAVRQHAAGQAQSDDITLLCFGRT